MNRKGFTLVEVAIVLVIIGIISLLAIKGKSLVDTAMVRKQVVKIQGLTVGLNVLQLRGITLSSPMTLQSGKSYDYVDASPLIDSGILTENDFYYQDLTTTPEYDNFKSRWPKLAVGNTNLFYVESEERYYLGFLNSIPTERFVCAIEDLLDDRSFPFGIGYFSTNFYNHYGLTYDNVCENPKNTSILSMEDAINDTYGYKSKYMLSL